MNATPLPETLEKVAQIAREGGKLIMPFFQAGCAGTLKSDRSPVTDADLAAHTFLVRALGELSPRLSVISEESEAREVPSTSDDYWLIDPLDGTKEFLKQKPEFTVNVALMREHRPVLGVVYAPATELTYLAQLGRGGWRQYQQNPGVSIHTRPANTDQLTVVASKDHCGPMVKRLLEQLPSASVTSIGSSLKFCLVAEGKADLYLRDLPTMEWDTAAAQCVLEAAGGLVKDLEDAALRYGKPGLKNPGFVAVGDPAFRWKEVLANGVAPT